MDDSTQLDKFVDEISALKRKTRLLEKLLRYYDDENKCWKPIKESWSKRFKEDKWPAPTPKEHLFNIISKELTVEEKSDLGLYNMY